MKKKSVIYFNLYLNYVICILIISNVDMLICLTKAYFNSRGIITECARFVPQLGEHSEQATLVAAAADERHCVEIDRGIDMWRAQQQRRAVARFYGQG